MTKIKDAMNTSNAMEVRLNGDVFSVGNFNLNALIQLEDEGISLQNIGELMADKPTTYATYFFWILIKDTDKKKFDNVITTFRKSLGIQDLEVISTAVGKAFESSHEQGDEKKTVKAKPKKRTGSR